MLTIILTSNIIIISYLFSPILGSDRAPAFKILFKQILFMLISIFFSFIGANISRGSGSMIKLLFTIVLTNYSSFLISYAAGIPLSG